MRTISPPDPTLVKDPVRFQQWLFELWKYVVSGSSDTMQVVLASRTFDGNTSTIEIKEDSQKILLGQTFGRIIPFPVIKEEAQDLLMIQAFLRTVQQPAEDVDFSNDQNILANQVFGG